ncbi:Sodium-dependent glucose transporter 1 like protein [Argiope bruennichi]|uniref:Sodium-dependent glucose transporter 1 like protein n=1 Tax=Argiope bruennichi TaxID=94029 RepID=A0A8T0F426_ARGBR|nr:Sodium-dependent glucose transporter 1 like protein [Argiope bruennichi]
MAIFTATRIKIFKTCNLYLCFLMLGMSVAIPGPTLLDLQNLVNTDMQHIAFIYTARSAGYLFGSLSGGVLFDMVARKQIILTIFNFVASLTMLGIPWSRSIGALTALMTVNGLSLGCLDTGGNVCCLNLWGKDSGPFYQALHFTFGLGALIAPLIAAPFVGNIDTSDFSFDNKSTIAANTTLQPAFHNFLNNSLVDSFEIPPITYAYSAIGGFAIFVTALFLIICIIAPLETQGQQNDESQVRERKLSFVLLIVFLNIILVFVETGTEVGYAQMLTTYVVKGPLQLSPTTGSYMTSGFWAAFSISRFLSVFLAIKFSNLQLIVFDIIISSIGALILLSFGASQVWAVWLATILLGVGIASFFPAAVGWVEKYMTVTNKMASSFCIGAAFGEMIIPFIISTYIDTVPGVLLYTVAASCALSAGVAFIMWLILRNKQDKYIKDEGTANAAYDAKIDT